MHADDIKLSIGSGDSQAQIYLQEDLNKWCP